MNSALQQDFRNFQNPQQSDVVRSQIASNILVDFGVIHDITDGWAYVKTFDLNSSGDAKYVNAEIVQAGTGIDAVAPGMICLLIYPKSPIQSLAKHLIYTGGSLYDSRTAKCLPLSCYESGHPVSLQHAGKTLVMATEKYSITYAPESITFLSPNVYVSLTDTEIQFTHGTVHLEIDSAGHLTKYTGYGYDVQNKVVNWKSKVEQNADGEIHIQTAEAKNDSYESFGKTDIRCDVAGNVELKTGVTKDNKFATNIKIEVGGKITLASYADGSEKASVVLNPDGTVTITTAAKYSIKGVGVAIDGTTGKVNIKNSSASMYTDILKPMLQKLNTSLATQGSPGAHTVVPNQFSTEATKLDALME